MTERTPSADPSRRAFMAGCAAALLMSGTHTHAAETEPIIDIHQHTNYRNRSTEQLLRHQQTMGVTQTILLPAGSMVNRPSTHLGKSNGLAAGTGGNESCLAVVREHPKAYYHFANEVADLPTARDEIEKYLKLGALGIGEQKFAVDCDSPHMIMLAELAQAYGVPVLMHFQHGMYNIGFERFGKMLEKFPRVTFIGHAQTWWANIDKNHVDQSVLYPKGKVTPGGMTDRYLSDYPNIYADISAGSGLNSMLRDEEHARGFLERHQDKILYGSDCDDRDGKGAKCSGAQAIAAIRRLAPSKQIERKILYHNAKKLFKGIA